MVFTMPLLEGLDGVQKMSQSLGNYVGITEPASEMFGKLMRIPDGLIVKYFRLCTAVPDHEVGEVERGLADGSLRPDLAKRRMARAVVELYHGPEAAKAAEDEFDLVHRRHEVPSSLPEVSLPAALAAEGKVWLPRLLTELGLVASHSEAKRQIEQGGVRIDGSQVRQADLELRPAELVGRVVQVGRRKFVKIAGPG